MSIHVVICKGSGTVFRPVKHRLAKSKDFRVYPYQRGRPTNILIMPASMDLDYTDLHFPLLARRSIPLGNLIQDWQYSSRATVHGLNPGSARQ